jgi:nicotinamidase-related amidase
MPGSRPVLLVMDFQHGIVERVSGSPVVDAADRAVKAARAAQIPVIFVRVAFRPGYPEVAENNATCGAVKA